VFNTTICVPSRIVAPILVTTRCLPTFSADSPSRYDASIRSIARPVLITWIVCYCFHTVAAPSGSLRLGALFTLGNSNRISFAEGASFLLGPLVPTTILSVPKFLIGLLFTPTPLPISRIQSSPPYSCRTLRKPATRALTPCAFVQSCVHTSFTSTPLWDEPTPRLLFEPHPLTASLGPRWNQTQPNLLTCFNPGEEDRVEGSRSE